MITNPLFQLREGFWFGLFGLDIAKCRGIKQRLVHGCMVWRAARCTVTRPPSCVQTSVEPGESASARRIAAGTDTCPCEVSLD